MSRDGSTSGHSYVGDLNGSSGHDLAKLSAFGADLNTPTTALPPISTPHIHHAPFAKRRGPPNSPNLRFACSRCRQRRLKCLGTLPGCYNCTKTGVHCDYLSPQEGDTFHFRKDRIRAGSGLRRDSTPLPNSINGHTSFQIVPHEQKPLSTKSSSMDSMELRFFSLLVVQLFGHDLKLVFYAMLSLAAFYFRLNSLKNFEGYSKSNKAQFATLRKALLRIANKYYSITISKLRKLIVRDNYNVYVAIFTSSLLNKLSIYKYDNLAHSVTFSKGIVGIYNDILANKPDTSKYSISWTINFLIMALKSIYFPSYTCKVLYEYRENLIKFRQLYDAARPPPPEGVASSNIIFHFEQLLAYVNQLLSILEQENFLVERLKKMPNLLYKLLRKCLIMLPSKLHIMDHVADPYEKCLMHLFRLLTRILDNVFPWMIFLFLNSFNGGIALNFEPHYELPPTFHTEFAEQPELREIRNYCIRASTFLQKRYNALSVFFGDQVAGERSEELLTPTLISESINEVMIERFQDTQVRYINYIHLPQQANLLRAELTPQVIRQIETTHLFSYNRDHIDYLKGEKTHSQGIHQLNVNMWVDPVLRFHMTNIISDDDRKNIFFSPNSAAKTAEKALSDITYQNLFEKSYAELFEKLIHDCYLEYFNGQQQTPPQRQMNPKNGLDFADQDPLLLWSPLKHVLKKRQRNLVTSDLAANIIVEYYQLRESFLNVPGEDDVASGYGTDEGDSGFDSD